MMKEHTETYSRKFTDDEALSAIEQLSDLVKALSVHQRQMFSKIEDLHAHHEQLYAQQNQIYEQVDALFSIFSMLKIRHPLPTMRGWPVSPDFVRILMSQIFERKPRVIVEAGCGVSTLISAYSLETLGEGHVTSLDHDGHFAEETRKNIRLHRLENQATVLDAPLGNVSINHETYPWYTFSMDNIPGPIDLLVIDGPPANMGDQVRYPAIPVFFDRLADDAVILLDDAAREGERKIVDRWITEFGCFEQTYIQTEKGAVILRKTRRP